MAIILDGQVISAPTLRAPISNRAMISGNFTADSAKALAARLVSASAQREEG
jgi:preprotein translocase subunit SecD